MESTSPSRLTVAALEEGRVLFNEGRYFEAHEVWEGAWRAEQGELKGALQGLIQVAAGYHKASVEQNALGAAKLLEMGLVKLTLLPKGYLGLSLEPFRAQVARDVGSARRWVASPVQRREPIRAGRLERAVVEVPSLPRDLTRAPLGPLPSWLAGRAPRRHAAVIVLVASTGTGLALFGEWPRGATWLVLALVVLLAAVPLGVAARQRRRRRT